MISWLPLPALYPISKLIFFLIYYFPGYRKNVVYKNLENSFPEKSQGELLSIRRRFYHHLSCVCVEITKLLNISQTELKRRCSFTPEAKELINSYLANNRSVLIVLAHYGNWEWGGASFFPTFGKKPVTSYKPLKNRVVDRFMKHLRSRFGIEAYPKDSIVRKMVAMRNEVSATALIADQTPSPANAHWVKFLNQDTPVFKGTARLSIMLNYPLIYCSPRVKKRGHYEVHAWLITSKPKEYDEYTISSLHSQILEKEIKRAPEYWLWSHKRWKHKKPAQTE